MGGVGMAGMPYPPKCVLGDNAHPNLLCVLCIPWENTITAGGVGMAGMPYPPKGVLWAVHLCLVGAAETAAPPERTSVHSVPRPLKN